MNTDSGLDFRPICDGFFVAPLDPTPPGPLCRRPMNPVHPLNNTAEPWASLYQQGYRDVLSEAFDAAVDVTGGLTPKRRKADFMKAGRSMLAAMSEETVMSIMDGTLPQFACPNRTRPDVGQFVLDGMVERQGQQGGRTYQPVFYASYLVDDLGFPPTEFELSSIVNSVEDYAKGGSRAFNERIDSALPGIPSWLDHRRGDRRYMMIDEDDEVEEAHEFIRAVRQKLPSRPSHSDRPRALGAFGITNHAGWCFQHHRRHQAGRNLMYLVEAICVAMFPAYRIRHHVVFKVFEPNQIWAGEILLNTIGKSLCDTGYGFGFLGRDLDFEEAAMQCVDASHYAMWEKNAIKHTPLCVNLDARIGGIRARRDRAVDGESAEDVAASEEYQVDGEEFEVLLTMLHGFRARED